ncbi:MAG: hypothetical protein H7333_08530, partial [Bdellovibrionales bacterium]|nr:hypothetical protein [Oligoflexia bacterium]
MNRLKGVAPLLLGLAALFAVNSQSSAQAIKTKSKNTVVMLAANYNAGEIEAVRNATEVRGEKFILIPKITPHVLEMNQLALEIDMLQLRKLEPLEDLHDKSMQSPKIAEMQSEIERLHFVIEDK